MKKAISLLDDIDLKILNELTLESYKVLKLAEKLGINHNSLKPHLNKLINVGLVDKYRGDENKIYLMTANNYFVDEIIGILNGIKISRFEENKIDLRTKNGRKTDKK